MFSNLFNRITKKIKKEEKPFNAEYAWFESTYGRDNYTPIETRIKNYQCKIKYHIKDCFKTFGNNSESTDTIYKCFIDIPIELKEHTEEIFKPFVKNNFKVVSLSDKIDELKDEYTYLISWKHIYR